MSVRAKKKVRSHLQRLRERAQAAGGALYVVSAHKTNQHIYMQLKDPQGRVIFGLSSLTAAMRASCAGKKGCEKAHAVGLAFAEKVKAMGLPLDRVAFDRSGFPYMGRIEALANGAREGGLAF